MSVMPPPIALALRSLPSAAARLRLPSAQAWPLTWHWRPPCCHGRGEWSTSHLRSA